MGLYNGAVITSAGQNLLAQAISGTELTWTVMRTSSVAIPQGTDLTTLTSLTGIKQTSGITDASVYGSNVVQVSARFSNTGISEAYLMQTIGIYGQGTGGSETLIAVMTAVTPDEMPVYDPDAPSAFIFNAQMSVQNANTITMVVNDTGTATVADLNRKVNLNGGDLSDTVVDTFTAAAAEYPVPAAGDTMKVIGGKIRKFFTDIKAAVVGLSISGRTITWTKADGTTGTLITQDTTYGVVSKNANGLAPKLPNETSTTKYLRQDGTWQVPPNTTYGLASTSTDGLLRKLTGNTSQWMRGDGTWQTAQNNATTTAAGYVLDARMGQTLNDRISYKVNLNGGDLSDTVVDTFTAAAAEYPVPAAGDTMKVIGGKIRKFFTDIKAAVVGLSISGRTITWTKADGTTGTLITQDTTYGVVSKNANGLAPKLPNETSTTKYLRQDGTWQVPPNTTYGLASTSTDGLLRKLTGNTSQWMRGDGTWQTAQNNATTTEAGYVLDARMGKTLHDRISYYADVLGVVYTYTPSATMTIPSTGLTNLMNTEQMPVGSYIITAHVELGAETDATTLITRLQLYREYDQRALVDMHPLTKTATIVFPDYVLNAGRYFIRITASKSTDASGDGARNYIRLMRIKPAS